MVKKAQIKFIIGAMSIILIVFVFVFGFATKSMRDQHINHIDNELTDIANDYYDLGYIPERTKSGLILVSDSYTFYDQNRFTKSEVDDIIEHATNTKVNFGNVNNVYYKHITLENSSQTILVAYDMLESANHLSNNTVNFLIPVIIIYFIFFLVVLLFSFKIFEPIKITLGKQRRFISEASHELKTPLTIISANAEVLKEINDNQWVDNIKSQTDRLGILITDMLDLAKMEETKMELLKENINVTQIVTDISLSFDAVAFEKNKTIKLLCDPDLFYVGDSQSLKKIVNILIDNAVKYATENSEILIKLKGVSEDKISLSVKNAGSHIPDEQSNKIFERFYRGEDSRNREYGGSGLGLSIAKGVANINKWKLTAKSKLNQSMEIILILT